MFMEKFVMTTTLTIEELDVPVTAAAYCVFVCRGEKLDAPEELDASAAAVATSWCGPCAFCDRGPVEG